MQKCSDIKDHAKQAKQRLSSGYWNEVKNCRQQYIQNHYQEGDNIEQLNYMFQKRVKEEIYSKQHPESSDEKLYKKVVKLLSENEYVLNPIIRLIDHEEFDCLSDVAKQNYLYELTEKYNQMKQRFEQEQKSKAGIYG